MVHSHRFSQDVWLWVPTKPRMVTFFLDQQGMVSPETLLPLVKSSQTPGIGQELVSDSGCSGGSPWWPQSQHLGGSIVSSFEDIIPLGPGTPSTFKAPHPSPHPLAFISMQAQAAQTQGDCSLCMLRVGGWEQAAHTPWQAQAAERLACPTLWPQTGSVHPPTLIPVLLQSLSPLLSS